MTTPDTITLKGSAEEMPDTEAFFLAAFAEPLEDGTPGDLHVSHRMHPEQLAIAFFQVMQQDMDPDTQAFLIVSMMRDPKVAKAFFELVRTPIEALRSATAPH